MPMYESFIQMCGPNSGLPCFNTTLLEEFPPPTASVNFGASGIAYALYRIAVAHSNSSLLDHANAWVLAASRESSSNMEIVRNSCFYNPSRGIVQELVGSVSPWHTESGIHLVRALIAHARGDVTSGQNAIESFVRAADHPCANPEVTLGYGGSLLGAAILLNATPEVVYLDVSSLSLFGHKLVRTFEDFVSQTPSIKESPIQFIGAAHGWAGMLHAALSWHRVAGTQPIDCLRTKFHELVNLGIADKKRLRWPRKVQDIAQLHPLANSMSGWCNGSAGIVFSLLSAERQWPGEGFVEAALAAGFDVFANPSASSLSLCCGLTGQSYALLSLHNFTGDIEWKVRARELASRIETLSKDRSDKDMSLYKGIAGPALLHAEIHSPNALRAFPLFETEK